MTAGNSPLWEDDSWTPFAPLLGADEADVCVVGLGGAGLTAVQEALDRGLRVIGLDAGPVAGGAAGRNGGFLLAGLAEFHHNARGILGADRARRLYECTIEQIDRMARETPEAVRRVGSLRLATTRAEETDCLAHFEGLREDRLPAERYRGAEGVGLLIPSDAAFNPLLRCRLLARRLAARGARLHEGVPALQVGAGAVDTPVGTIRAGIIILAADGGLAALAPTLADRVRPVRLQMLGTAPTDEVRIPRPVYARFGMEYWQQLDDGRITLGGFRDRGGEAEWTCNATPTEPVQSALKSFLRDTLGVRAPITHRWAATVSYTRDGILPVLEQVEPGVWAMGAYNGTGNLVGPLCARAAVEMAVTGRSELGELLGAGKR
ncbi:MAG TPA: FAD-binding oxidoreductase [Gemmatimonadales bacterium]|nr:FAD-binding oxidoreductase [Gemmatimonadales bacterium]